MKLSLRFILPLTILLGIIAYLVVPVVDRVTMGWFQKDLDLRGKLISRSLNVPLRALLDMQNDSAVAKLFEDFAEDERLLAIGFCDVAGRLIFKTSHFPAEVNCQASSEGPLISLPEGPIHLYRNEVSEDAKILGTVIIIHDMNFVKRRSQFTQNYVLLFFVVLTIIITVFSVIIAQVSWRSLINEVRSLLKHDSKFGMLISSTQPELRPIARDLKTLVRELERVRKVRENFHQSWTPSSLKELLNNELFGEEILILSNREPYIHQKEPDGSISLKTPASGLVTALEPIMRACSGTWIAHGSGSADKLVVDHRDCVAVPPESPSYKIRRVWLSPEEEQGYYYGFSNEAMWPLCHIAHTRPTFRADDWEFYVKVNEKFAKAVVDEAKTENPVVLIQDYHFALAPKMIRKILPNATIITFWHIPWPNAESFGICPWREEILEGLLGSSILGFHTRFHCNNFFESTERYLECRVDKDTSMVSFNKKLTLVNDYPISIEWPPKGLDNIGSFYDCRQLIRLKNNVSMEVRIGVGVDRLDYTKGILERFLSIERLLQLYPKFIGRFTFVQIAAPSRSAIKEYRYFAEDVRQLAEKINRKYSHGDYVPILLQVRHHDQPEVFEYFRGADVCFVSSLHDGMNLVAKEFIASRDDEMGVLLLSQFTGAAKELNDALIVNPYDIDQCAHTLAEGLEMPISEQKERMRSLRAQVQENNVYKWAGKMLVDGAKYKLRNRYRLSGKSGEQWKIS